MDKRPNPEEGRTKKRYAKPEIEQVSLRPEEAVLANCKIGNRSGSGQPRCGGGGYAPCSAIAS